MSVFKRPGTETYSYDFRVKGVRYSGNTGAAKKRAAEKFEDAERKKALAVAETAKGPLTVQRAILDYWNEIGAFHKNSDTTLRDFAWIQKELGNSTLISNVGDADVTRLITKRRLDDVTPTTINRSVTQPMRALLKRAAEVWGQSVRRINWRGHLLKEPEERVRELTPAEEILLFAKLRADYHPIVRFALQTGCRLQECVDLRWRHVDFQNRIIRVKGKGEKTRTVPITPSTEGLLSELRSVSGSIPRADDQVFTYVAMKAARDERRAGRHDLARGKRYPITRAGLKITFARAVAKAEIHDLHFHDLRHTCATRLLRKSNNLRLVKDLLGHTDMNVTLKYAHATNDDLRAAMNATEIATTAMVDAAKVAETKGKIG